MMKDLEDKSLQFVLDNYKKGMFDTRKALEKITKEKPVKQLSSQEICLCIMHRGL